MTYCNKQFLCFFFNKLKISVGINKILGPSGSVLRRFSTFMDLTVNWVRVYQNYSPHLQFSLKFTDRPTVIECMKLFNQTTRVFSVVL